MIEYEFTFAEGPVRRFRVGDESDADPAPPPPEWTRLDFHQCANCPLATAEHPRCPTAVDVFRIAEEFGDLLSYERVAVTVSSADRDYSVECDLQTGLGSLLGLVMAQSDCPHLATLRPLAHFHLPFASFEETLFRTVGLYLLRQYFAARRGEEPDFELAGLADLYDDLQTVNIHFKQRMEAASRRDANINAIALLFSLSSLVSISLESGLRHLEALLGARR